MKSQKPKVLAEILFKPMLGYVIDACKTACVQDICVVCGYQAEMVVEYLDTKGTFFTALQKEQKGTGHAVMMAREFLESSHGKDVLVLCGDTPFLDSSTIEEAYRAHKTQGNAVTVITAKLPDPSGYGRIVRNGESIRKIVEQKDASQTELEINEINAGAYWFDVDNLIKMLESLTTENAQGEYYLTDTIGLTLEAGNKVGGYTAPDSDIILGANSRRDLFNLGEKMRMGIINRHFENGVEFVSTDGVLIAPDAVIGADTRILPGTILKNGVTIGEDCVIGPNTMIQSSSIGSRTKLNAVQCFQSVVHDDVDIGPFVHIRPNSEIKSFVHIGDFVEVKNSTIGEGTGISHLTYIGDSDVGKNVNFGCGVVTVNYDGINKNRCTIEDEAFIGCNTNLVAPVRVGKSAYTGAGSTITKDVPDYALAIGRSRQETKPEYAAKKLAGRKKKV